MADESLVTLDDARELIEAQACDIFNIRISKCGGIARSLEFARLATEAGIGYQLGAHVGETSILAAAGRQLALALPSALFVEGSIGTLLLEEDVADPPVLFDSGGMGGALGGAGLGIEVLDERLEQYAVRTIELGSHSR